MQVSRLEEAGGRVVPGAPQGPHGLTKNGQPDSPGPHAHTLSVCPEFSGLPAELCAVPDEPLAPRDRITGLARRHVLGCHGDLRAVNDGPGQVSA
jgi:hypothetical protein